MMDADVRREQVVEAVVAVIAERGLAETKLVTVAERAGVSVGLVQHHFRSKSQLLRSAVEHVSQRIEARVERIRDVRPLRVGFQELAEVLLPLDDERRREAVVWAAFVPVTAVDDDLAALHRAALDRQLVGFERVFSAAQHLGEVPAGLDGRLESAALTAFLDGLSSCMLHSPDVYDGDTARRMLGGYLDRIFAGRHTPGAEGARS
ncbi:TetR/AcrR family transcriptional regulator [Pseudonocardia sp. TRM90224]|uniref:TetR/AcrR family transcriptional regulator n=1 Tax=Pseudonocardia sp. TRM90224 TaxID=2812678 RepID=UPI001E286993|nr:TetR/AcrR family transcriptional regulator [Pseudonocardia sp. TRM90224]